MGGVVLASHSRFKKVLPVLLGNTLEAYDLCLYGLLAVYFSRVFFPQSNNSLTLAFLLFSIAYLARPIGSLLWGYIADKYGRKPVLIGTLSLMAIPAIGMAVMPSYETIGTTASLTVIFLRFLQGIAFGGEFPTIMVTLYELASAKKRGLYGSCAPGFFVLGYLIAMLMIMILTNCLSENQMLSFGWRIPCGLSIIFIAIIFYIRFNLTETIKVKNNNPISDAFRENWRSMLKIALYLLCQTCMFYNIMFYTPILLKKSGILADSVISILQFFCALIIVILAPLMGYISDSFGRHKMSKCIFVFLIVFAWPLYTLILSTQLIMIVFGIMFFSVILSVIVGSFPSVIVGESYSKCRVSIVGIGYTLVTLLGSFTPVINEQLISYSENKMSPVIYMIICAIVSLITIYQIKDRQFQGN